MGKLLKISGILSLLFLLQSCVVHETKHPRPHHKNKHYTHAPGQMKKKYGGHATDYAPGKKIKYHKKGKHHSKHHKH